MKSGRNPAVMTVTAASRSCKPLWAALLLLVAYWLPALSAVAVNIENAACLECHGEKDAEQFIDGPLFEGSVHADNQCTSCHSDITEPEHDTPLKKVDCAECHDLEAEIYLQSSHGISLVKGRDQAATCKDCHGDAPHSPRQHFRHLRPMPR